MFYYDPVFIHSVQQTIEILGTLAFAVSGIRHAAARHYDWFGGFVCGFVVAIGGGTLRDVMLGVTPFWMTSPMYIVCTFLAQAMVILFARLLRHLDNAWFFFDTLGLALFTIAGCGMMLTTVQANGISTAAMNSLGVKPLVTGLVLAFLIGLVIVGGIKRISKVLWKDLKHRSAIL